MLYSVDSSIQMQRVLKFAASIRDICQVRDVVRKKNGIMWEDFSNLGEGSDPNPLHIFRFFFYSSGAYKMAKKYLKKKQ